MPFVKETGRTQNGKEYRYYHIVESYRDDNGDPKHNYLANISDLPDKIIEQIDSLLSDEVALVDTEALNLEVGDALRGGGQMALWRAWEKADMDKAFSGFSDKQVRSIKAMVFSRVTNPCSKRALKTEMADTFLADMASTNRLDEDTLYHLMDRLADNFQSIQKQLRDTRDRRDTRLLLYDTTSTYFEGTEADPGEYGHSKDKRWDRYQIIVGVVTDRNGLPLAVEVWKGNKHDANTINDRVETLRDTFGFEAVTFVSDSGTYSTENIQTIREAGFDYITSMAWQSQKKRLTDLSPKQLKLFDERGTYQWKEGETRYVGCESAARKQRARSRRLDAMKAARDELDRLKETAGSGSYYTKLRLHEKVMSMLKQKGVADLFTVSIQPCHQQADEEQKCPQQLTYRLDGIALRKRRALEGKYILRTSLSEKQAGPEQVNDDYQRLQQVERGFRHIKSYLKIRPIYHRLDRRIRAHVLICFLAYYLVRWMQNRLREAGEEREVERLIKRWDQLKLVEQRLSFDGYETENWNWSRGELGEKVVQEIEDVGWWRSIQAYKRSITKQL